MERELYKVSVIVPVYNVERFIERCVISLFRQTLEDVEFIFVDDSTPDQSMDLLMKLMAEYPHRKADCVVLKHESNRGLPAARNTGLAVARGKYIFHMDSDDFAEPDMLKDLYAAAEQLQADLVWSDWFLSYQEKERYMPQPNCKTPKEALEAVLSGTMKYNVWNKLIRRSLYDDEGILFPEGYSMGEDMTIIKLMACAKSVAYVPHAYYHYVRTNSGAMTASWSEKHLADINHNVGETIGFIRRKFGEKFDLYLEYFKLSIKLPLLISDDFQMYRLWSDWYQESNRFIWKNKSVCFRTRTLQWFAWKKQYWVLWLYNKILQEFVYKLILGYK